MSGVIRKTSVARLDAQFKRSPEDGRERLQSLRVDAKGSLSHESWTRYPNGTDHATLSEGAELSLTFYGVSVSSPDDVARSLRALADAIEKAQPNP